MVEAIFKEARRLTKCYICERNLGEEAGWDICFGCVKRYPAVSEAILTGEVIVIRYPKGITLSGANLVLKLVKKE